MIARSAIAGLAPVAAAVAVATATVASAASVHPLDGRPVVSAASVRPLDGRSVVSAASVRPLDGRPVAAAPSVHPLDGHPRAAAPSVRLTVDVARRPGARRVAHLSCTGATARADGFLRAVGAGRACTHARRIAGLLAARPDPHRACSQIYGGPERALVTGTIGARRIRHGFSRTNGCGVADWRRAMPLLPRPG